MGRHSMTLRSRKSLDNDNSIYNENEHETSHERESLKNQTNGKRRALGDVTNRQSSQIDQGKKKEKLSESTENDVVTRRTRSSISSAEEQKVNYENKITKSTKTVRKRGPQSESGGSPSKRLCQRNENDDLRSENQNLPRYLIRPELRLHVSHQNHNRDYIPEIGRYDRVDEGDVLLVAPYVTSILQNAFEQEEKTRPTMYMDRQPDIQSRMRAILVDWLVEVHRNFRLVPETLYLCVNIIDRYCRLVRVGRSNLQLVGVTALCIACKYEEIYPPEITDYVYVTDRAYTREDVLNMEQDIIHRLSFKLSVPTGYIFVQRFINLLKLPALAKHATSYYMERTLQEHDLLKYRPSLVCASSLLLAINNPAIRSQVSDFPPELKGMPKILLEYTGFDPEELLECADLVAKKVSEQQVTASNRHLNAVKKKYDHLRYMKVSSLLNPLATNIRDGEANHA